MDAKKAKLLGTVAFLIAAVVIVVLVMRLKPQSDTLQDCIHVALVKEAHVDDAKAAKLAYDYSVHASADGGDAPGAMGLMVTNRTLSTELLQAMSDDNVGRVIDACAAHFNAGPPDAIVSVTVKAAGAPAADVRVVNKARATESCTTEKGTGACSLVLRGVKRSDKYAFDAILANFVVTDASSFSFEQLGKGVELDLKPSGRKPLKIHVLDGENDLAGATVEVIADDGDVRNADCNEKGIFGEECAKADTRTDGTARFFFTEPLTVLSVDVGFHGKTKRLYHKNKEDELERALDLHWPAGGGLPQSPRGTPVATVPACSADTNNAIKTALVKRTAGSPLASGPIVLRVQVGEGGNVVSVGGDKTNALYAPASAALTSRAIDYHAATGCSTTVTWER